MMAPHTFIVLAVEKGYTLHIHNACSRNGYILTSTTRGEMENTPTSSLLTLDRDTPSLPHPAGGENGYTLTPTLLTVEMNIPCGGIIYTILSK
jgi:hypothetical protein